MTRKKGAKPHQRAHLALRELYENLISKFAFSDHQQITNIEDETLQPVRWVYLLLRHIIEVSNFSQPPLGRHHRMLR